MMLHLPWTVVLRICWIQPSWKGRAASIPALRVLGMVDTNTLHQHPNDTEVRCHLKLFIVGGSKDVAIYAITLGLSRDNEVYYP